MDIWTPAGPGGGYAGLPRVKNAGSQKLGFRVLTLGWTCCVTLDKAGLLLCLQIWGLIGLESFHHASCPTCSVGMPQEEGAADPGLTGISGSQRNRRSAHLPSPASVSGPMASAVVLLLQIISASWNPSEPDGLGVV